MSAPLCSWLKLHDLMLSHTVKQIGSGMSRVENQAPFQSPPRLLMISKVQVLHRRVRGADQRKRVDVENKELWQMRIQLDEMLGIWLAITLYIFLHP